MSTVNAMCVYDFTCHPPSNTRESVTAVLENIAKKWAFQLEEGTQGRLHFQGRFSLKIKKRLLDTVDLLKSLGAMDWHLGATSAENRGNMFYVTKTETRVEGPWMDTDETIFIPWQYKGLSLRPWQQHVCDSSQTLDSRVVDCVIDPIGGIGKSVLVHLCALHHGAIILPFANDSATLVASLLNLTKSRNIRTPGLVFFDIPRALKKDKLQGLYGGLETIKNGLLTDIRYKCQQWWIDSPRIWVFTNIPPDTAYLSRDRWRFWQVHNGELVHVPVSHIAKFNLLQQTDEFAVYELPRVHIKSDEQEEIDLQKNLEKASFWQTHYTDEEGVIQESGKPRKHRPVSPPFDLSSLSDLVGSGVSFRPR